MATVVSVPATPGAELEAILAELVDDPSMESLFYCRSAAATGYVSKLFSPGAGVTWSTTEEPWRTG